MSLVLAVLGLAQLTAVAVSPAEIVSRATKAIETDSGHVFEQRWRNTLRQTPQSAPALLGLATIARLTFHDSTAESLYARVINRPTPDAFSITARIGLASVLANGRSPALADSTLSIARREAQRLSLPVIEAQALVALASVRGRSIGTRAALDLIAESKRVQPVMPPREDAFRACLEGSFGSRAGNAAAESSLVRGRRSALRERAWRVLGDCQLMQAQVYEHRGSFDRALIMLDTAESYMRMARSHGALAIALQWGAFVRLQAGDVAQAQQDYMESVALVQQTHNAAVEAWALTGLAQIAVMLGDLSGGRNYLTRAMAMHLARNDRWGYATVRELEGELNDALGDVPAARASLTEAIAVQTQIGQQLLAVAPLRRLARLELSQGRLDEADRAIEKATQLALASRDAGWLRELPYHQAGSAIARGRYAQADSLLRIVDAQMLEIGAHSNEMAYNLAIRHADNASRQSDWEQTERWMTRAGNELDAWRRQLADKDIRLRAAQARRSWGNIGEEFPLLISRLAGAGRLAPALALLESVRARELASIAMQRVTLNRNDAKLRMAIDQLQIGARAPTLQQLQQSLNDSTVLLAYSAGRGRIPTTLIVVSRTSATSHSLAPLDSIAIPLQRFLRLLSDGSSPTAVAKQLGNALLSQAVAALPPTVSRLIVVPELSLFRVPFDALILPDGRFAAERFTIAVVPSVSVAMAPLPVARTPTSVTLLAFGDAAYGAAANAIVLKSASDSSPSMLPRTPYSGDEARRVARYFTNSRVLVRAAASENALRRANLRDVGVLHFATHALMDDRSLPRNMLALAPSAGSDGLVGPDELGSLELRGTLIVLSGCRTIGGLVLGGEGLRGLAAPLLEAGARTIVATHWAIGDASVVPFIDRFYAHMSRGHDVGTALRKAKQDAIRDGVGANVWAAFTLVGDGAMRVPLRPIASVPLPWRPAQ